MTSLAESTEIIGFFSYSRDDDEAFKGTLSALRDMIQRELAAQLGRSKKNFRLWQDLEAIAAGTLWESEIKTAVSDAVFFIPIVTPRAVNSQYCRFEFESFLSREKTLGRSDLVFPLLYISVPGLEDESKRKEDRFLSLIAERHYIDWRPYRYLDPQTPAVRQKIGDFCGQIVNALQAPWNSPAAEGRAQHVEQMPNNSGAKSAATNAESAQIDPQAEDHNAPLPPLTLPARPSIAVLPFTNMSGDTEQEYFADGVAEEILTALSRCTWLFVVARNSSFIYKGKSIDVRRVSRELGVRYVLEGSVRRVANKVRFTAQLVDATTGAHIWADRFDGDYSDLFELQDRIAECVVAAIEPNLQLAEIERVKSKPAKNLDAFDLLLKAQRLEHTFTQSSVLDAIMCLEQALEIDPSYAPAMALAAYCYGERRFQGWTKNIDAETEKGLQYADRAVELAPDDATVLYMSALATWQLGSDIRHAKEWADRSLLMNPNSAIACTIAGWIDAYSGSFDRGLSSLQRALRLNPRDPRAWFTAAGISIAYLGRSEFEQGAGWAKRALAQNARYTVAMRLLAANASNAGRPEDGRDAIRAMLQIEPTLTLATLQRRLSYMDRDLWNNLARGLCAAGLPEG